MVRMLIKLQRSFVNQDMIIQADAKSLEVVCGAYLSKDQVLIQELTQGLDIHALNQKVLGLPPGDLGRLIAKIFIFRLMYGGSAYSYANDSDFTMVSTSEKFWQQKIDGFYHKYKQFAEWHVKIVKDAVDNGYLRTPSGRQYDFELVRNYRNDLEPPQTLIKNYPVQGLGADVMSIARVSFRRRQINGKMAGLSINTIHDSIVCDIPEEWVGRYAQTFHDVFADIPRNFKLVFGVEFDLPLRCEVKAGPNMMEMEEYKIAI